jgi:hypothetical protein
MSFRRSILVFIVSHMLAATTATAVFASDITIAPSPRKTNAGMTAKVLAGAQQQTAAHAEKAKRGNGERPETKKSSAKKEQAIKPEKAKRAKKSQQREIAAYHLFNDPLTGKRKLGIAHGEKGFGINPGHTILGSTTSSPLQGILSTSGDTPYKTDSTNGDTPFDCREKPSGTSLTQRQLTACYVHKVDRSWKTETYLSRKFYDGTANWGGGLLLSYDY